jgi:hypothetical protein
LVLVGYTLAVRSTRFTIERGRLQIKRGIFSSSLANHELWRVQDIRLTKSLWNRITGDGTLTFDVHYPNRVQTVAVTGLAKSPALDDLHQQLLNLVFLLRGNAAVKGLYS